LSGFASGAPDLPLVAEEFDHGDAEAFLDCANDLGDFKAVGEYEDDEAAKGSGHA
jgi:hypothetical protein